MTPPVAVRARANSTVGYGVAVDGDLFWTIVGVVVSIIALAVTIVIAVITITRQFPKRRLSFVTGETRLVSGRVPLEVAYGGEHLGDPRVVELAVVSDSRADIPSSAFDGGRPLVLELDTPVIAVLEQRTQGIIIGQRGQLLELEPQLIRAGASSDLTLLVEGRLENIGVDSPLIDIPVREVGDQSDLWSSGRGRQTAGLLAALVSMSVVAGVLISSALAPVVAVIGLLANLLLGGS